MENLEKLINYLNAVYNLNISINKNYILAFTHSSYINENKNLKKGEHYERLEFLGDATLELVTSKFLYDKFPNLSEGELTKIRASIVCETSLVKYTKLLSFDKYILLGKGEEKIGGRERNALLADIFEAFIGALYIDKGIDEVMLFLEKTLFQILYEKNNFVDYKTILQEYVDSIKKGNIQYILKSTEGPSHNKVFSSIITINKKKYGQGIAKTKKESEQLAAKVALESFDYFKEN